MVGLASSGDWRPVSAAPRDGTPVVLWLSEDEEPPVLPQPVGFWVVDPVTGAGGWRIFGRGDRSPFVTDDQIRGWKALLRE